MVEHRRSLVLYNGATCNLKCRYCYIDKNPALLQIDKVLEESFKGDYYINFAKEIFPIRENLKEIQIWGGEPTLTLDRVHHTLEGLFKEYPNIETVLFSTNLTPEDTTDQIFRLVKCINKAGHPIELDIQLSLDGPTYINDYNRGEGTTEKFSKNFVKLMSRMPAELKESPNVNICAFFKPTLDLDSISKLQTKQAAIEYYQFLESFSSIAHKVHHSRFEFNDAIPNVAEPIPVTVEDGLKFKNLCKLWREIENENLSKRYLKYYTHIVPYNHNLGCVDFALNNKGCCGTGRNVVGLLPNDLISTCHVGFTQVLESYKKEAAKTTSKKTSLVTEFFNSKDFSNDMVFHKSKLADYEKQIEEFYNSKNYFQVTSLMAEIQILAAAGQIESKYIDFKEAKDGATFLLNHTAYCIRNNINTTGSKQIIPHGIIKLLLNGAREYITEEKNDCKQR